MALVFQFLTVLFSLLASALVYAQNARSQTVVVNVSTSQSSQSINCQGDSFEEFVQYAVSRMVEDFAPLPHAVNSITIRFSSSFGSFFMADSAGNHEIFFEGPMDYEGAWWLLGHELGHLINIKNKVNTLEEGFASSFATRIAVACSKPYKTFEDLYARDSNPIYGHSYLLFNEILSAVSDRTVRDLFLNPFYDANGQPDITKWIQFALAPLEQKKVVATFEKHYPNMYDTRQSYRYADELIFLQIPLLSEDERSCRIDFRSVQ